MTEESKGEGSPRSLLQLRHHRQRSTWDCGVACVLMVLPESQQEQLLLNFTQICAEEEFNKSTWTIDLCYLLKRFGAELTFCTVTLGVQAGYTSQPFYSRILTQDEGRVKQRFAEAPGRGIRVEEASLSPDELIGHLARCGPVILLTDANRLQCDVCKANRLSSELRQCLPWPPSYQGHYIVLCGYDLNKKVFFYRNPTFRDRVCVMNYEALNEARTSFGTDEDAILVFSPHLERTNSLASVPLS